jgi:hypothetical protein
MVRHRALIDILILTASAVLRLRFTDLMQSEKAWDHLVRNHLVRAIYVL